MKHGFLIMTHLPPEKIHDQIKRLQAPDHYFFIHFDKKQQLDLLDPYYIALNTTENVFVVKHRINVQWGSFRIVQATVELMKEAAKHKNIGYLHLLSGECLHIKSREYLNNFFITNAGHQFMDNFLMPVDSKAHTLTYQRLDKYYLYGLFNPRSKKNKDVILGSINNVLRKGQRILKKAGIYRRYSSEFPTLYAGSAWWSLSSDACAYILRFINDHPDFYKRLQYSLCPDEMFFQTIIMNSPFKDSVINDNLRFINFSGLNSYPTALTIDHIAGISKENKLFARKFTPESKSLIDYLEKHVY